MSSCGFMPDGRLILSYPVNSSNIKARIELWKVQAQAPDHTMMSTTAWLSFAYGPNLFATYGERSEVKLWDANTWKELPSYFEHSEFTNSIIFSKDGTKLIGLTDGYNYRPNNLTYWKFKDESQTKRIDFKDEVNQVLVPKTGPVFYALSDGCQINIIDKNSKIITSAFKLIDCAEYIELSKDETKIYVQSENLFSMYDLKTQARIQTISLDMRHNGRVAILPDESAIVYYSSFFSMISKMNLATGKVVWAHSNDGVFSADGNFKVSPDAKTILVSGKVGNIEKSAVLDIENLKTLAVLDVTSGSFIDQNTVLGFKDYGKTITLIDWRIGNEIFKFNIETQKDSAEFVWARDAIISKDKKTLYILKSKYLDIFDIPSKQYKRTLMGHVGNNSSQNPPRLNDLKLLNPTELLTAGIDGTIRVWNVGN